MKKVTYDQFYQPIYLAILHSLNAITEDHTDWSNAASPAAERIIDELLRDNKPWLWEAKLNEGTEFEESFICYDPSGIEEKEVQRGESKE